MAISIIRGIKTKKEITTAHIAVIRVAAAEVSLIFWAFILNSKETRSTKFSMAVFNSSTAITKLITITITIHWLILMFNPIEIQITIKATIK